MLEKASQEYGKISSEDGCGVTFATHTHTNTAAICFLLKNYEDVCAHLLANLSILLHQRFVPVREGGGKGGGGKEGGREREREGARTQTHV